MPRNVKESDDEVETKGVRRTRATVNSSVLDSPLRRSSRIKPPVNQDASSPESVSDVAAPKNTRRRTVVGDTGIPDAPRTTRGRRNSTASDISELTETESLPDGPPRRITRRSIAGPIMPDTPTMLNGRTRRATRAGSETKSTPPVAKPVRRTRASSMEPETIEETKARQVGTPVNPRKRASVMPSEPAVAEESEDGKTTDVTKNVERTVYEIEEDESDAVSHNTSASLRQKSIVDVDVSDEKMEVDDSPVKETSDDIAEKSVRETTEESIDISGVSRKLDDSMEIADPHGDNVALNQTSELEKLPSVTKDLSRTDETILNRALEKQEKSPGNKENEVFNCGNVSIDRGVKLTDNEAHLVHKSAFRPTLAKIAEKRRSVSSEDNFGNSKFATKNQEIAETVVKKAHLVDNCVVVIEPMDINKVDKSIVAQASVVSNPKDEDDKMPKLDSNTPFTEQQKRGVEQQKENTENIENLTKDEDIVDGDSNLQISNVVSMAPEEEPTKVDDQPVDERNAEAMKIDAPIETIDLEFSVVEGEETGKNLSIVGTKPIDSPNSVINENPKSNEETEEIIVLDMVKEKSSIVTESPVSGTNAVEATDSIEEKSNDKSAANGYSPAPISEKVVEDPEPEPLKKKNAAEQRVAESDDDSEYSGCPAFKDITADEWTGPDAEANKKNTSDDTNSLHSASTERNESECEIELVDKEAPPIVENSERKREEKSDYDTDDTMITQMYPVTKETEDKRNDVKSAVDDVTPMDLSSDPDEDGGVTSKSSRESSKKRSSLATPRKSIGANTPLKNKNVSMTCSMDVESTNTDSPKKDDANVSLKSNKSPKKRSSLSAGRPKNGDSCDSDEDTEKDQAADRKSLDASAKRLDTSRNNVSAKNTPSKIENEISVAPTKRRSSNKFTQIINYDDSEDELDDVEDENKSQSSSESGPMQSGIDDGETFANATPSLTPMKQGKSRLSGIRVSDANSSSTPTKDTRSSPLVVKEQHNTSVKTGSARKSISSRSPSKITELNSDSELDDESLAKEKSSKPKRASVNKNDLRATENSSDSEMEVGSEKNDPSSPKIDEEILDRSSKQGSARKSMNNEDILNRSSKQGSARKSINNEEILNRSSKQGSARKSINNEEILNRSSKQESARKSINNEEILNRSSKEGSARKSMNTEEILNRSSKQGSARKSMNNEESLNRSSKQGSARKSTNNEEILNSSSKQESARKSMTERNNSRTASASSDSEAEVSDSKKSSENMETVSQASKSALIDTDSESDEQDVQRKVPKSKIGSGIKLAFDVDNNYSTIAQVNSDSEIEESSSSEEDASSILPHFFFDQDSTSSSSSVASDDSSDTIDSDVARDLNLHGKSILEYSDDDVPADDCMATESESSDSDDDGADLMDFVVDDEEEEDTFEDVAMDLDAGENDDSSDGKKKKKQRRRIIPRPGGDSDSNESNVENAPDVESDINDSATAKTPKQDKKLNKSNIADSELQSGDLSALSKAASKKNKNILLQSSTPRGRKDERPVIDKVNSPKAATPLSKSMNNKTPKKADSSTKVEASETPLSKKLSKSLCKTDDTPAKLSSSFKIAKSPKTPGLATKQLQTSLPIDFSASVNETHLSKTKSPKLTALHQTMTTPNSESPETRFLMKEKLNDSLPALKLQQRVTVSRRSTLDNLREVLSEEQSEHVAEDAAAASLEAAAVEPEVDETEKKKRKKKKAAKNTSIDLDSKSLGTSMETEGASIDNESNECLGEDASRDVSKKRDKKKKTIAEMPAEEAVEPKNEDVLPKDKKKKKKKLEDNVEEILVSEPSKKDKTKRKKQLDGIADEVETIETSKKEKKKKKKLEETFDEVESIEIDQKDKKKKKKKREETVEEVVTEQPIKKDKKRKHEKTVEAAKIPTTKKKSSNLDDSTEVPAVQDAKLKRQQRRTEDRLTAPSAVLSSKTTLKRLSDEVLESLTDVPERPTKRRKIAKQDKIVPSRSMFDNSRQPTANIKIDDGFIPLSASGGTTQFAVVNLQKATKKSKRSVVASSFRERMLARNPRQPISAYLMYQQKQKASGKNRP